MSGYNNAILHKLWLRASLLGDEIVDIITPVLDNPAFSVCSGSGRPGMHHYGDGGLLAHTAEVVDLCFVTMQTIHISPLVDDRLMFLSAFWHDVGKMWDHALVQTKGPTIGSGGVGTIDPPVFEWGYTDHKRLIHHISRSVLEFNKAVDAYHADHGPYLTQDEINSVTHAILSHHGRHEYHSPVTPQTKMAWILHLCDSISARVYDTDLPQ